VQQKRAYWRRLDHAAKLFSATSTTKDTRVFRFYCELKEMIQEEVLQEALNQTLKTYPIFLSVMRKGVFWHYLEKSGLRPTVRMEEKEPCSNLYDRERATLLFEVTYYRNRINFEVFHALTDGTGAMEFLRELIKNYIYILHEDEGIPSISFKEEHITVQDQESDAFSKYYNDGLRKRRHKKKAFQLKKPFRETGRLQVSETVLSVSEVLKRSRQLGVSMTVFLTTVYLMAIQKEMTKQQQKKRPVILMVPVNLRKFFPSDSMLNFFHYIEPGYHFGQKEASFEEVLASVKAYFQEELRVERIAEHMNDLIALEVHPILRIAPLDLKNFAIKTGARLAQREVTAIFSNMGAVQMPPEYAVHIERFGVYTSTPKMELCMCSFGDLISLGFTSRFDTVNIQRNFYMILKEQGISHQVIAPSYPECEDQREMQRKGMRIYTFLCFALALGFLFVDHSASSGVHWSLFAVSGVVSMWLISVIGYLKRGNVLKNAIWQLSLVSIGSAIWNFALGGPAWSLEVVVPILSMFVLGYLLLAATLGKYTVREVMSYLWIVCGVGIVVPLLGMFLGLVKWKLLCNLSVFLGTLVLAGVRIFYGKMLKEELYKKFHV
jgi:NRPS condensation-like uncharacterized protein